MKKRVVTAGLALALSATLMQGCYGNFNLTRKLYTWNGSLGDKFVNSLVMVVMVILPVYWIAGAADLIILNVVEFWTGKNPMALAPGEKQIQVVEHEGRKYLLTATPNRLDVSLAEAGSPVTSLVFDPATRSWSAVTSGGTYKLIEQVDDAGRLVDLIHPDGSRERLALD